MHMQLYYRSIFINGSKFILAIFITTLQLAVHCIPIAFEYYIWSNFNSRNLSWIYVGQSLNTIITGILWCNFYRSHSSTSYVATQSQLYNSDITSKQRKDAWYCLPLLQGLMRSVHNLENKLYTYKTCKCMPSCFHAWLVRAGFRIFMCCDSCSLQYLIYDKLNLTKGHDMIIFKHR